jgi:hypothetical protein
MPPSLKCIYTNIYRNKKHQAMPHTYEDNGIEKQARIHTLEPGIADQKSLDVFVNPRPKEDKKWQVGINFQEENFTGQRICALLNWGLSDLPQSTLNRIMASRQRALDLLKNFSE